MENLERLSSTGYISKILYRILSYEIITFCEAYSGVIFYDL